MTACLKAIWANDSGPSGGNLVVVANDHGENQ
jgi:hypothetical protein